MGTVRDLWCKRDANVGRMVGESNGIRGSSPSECSVRLLHREKSLATARSWRLLVCNGQTQNAICTLSALSVEAGSTDAATFSLW